MTCTPTLSRAQGFQIPFLPNTAFLFPPALYPSMGYMVLLQQSRKPVLTACAAMQGRRWDHFTEFGKMSANGLHERNAAASLKKY